jgi:hypothetical protein
VILGNAQIERIDGTETAWWVCRCGNEPDRDGFVPCTWQGEDVQPTPAAWTEPLYRCDRCGRIIDQETGLVIGSTGQVTSPRRLPVFRGYTVDVRLREFRRVEPGRRLVFVPFDSPRGRRLLTRLKRAG